MQVTPSLKIAVAAAILACAILAFALLVSPGAPASPTGSGSHPNATPGPHASDPPGYTFAVARD